jgi:hypothetical protein
VASHPLERPTDPLSEEVGPCHLAKVACSRRGQPHQSRAAIVSFSAWPCHHRFGGFSSQEQMREIAKVTKRVHSAQREITIKCWRTHVAQRKPPELVSVDAPGWRQYCGLFQHSMRRCALRELEGWTITIRVVHRETLVIQLWKPARSRSAPPIGAKRLLIQCPAIYERRS